MRQVKKDQRFPDEIGVTGRNRIGDRLKLLIEPTGRAEGDIKTGEGPYQDLYIYLLKGVVKEQDENSLGAAFVGNWVEDDSSFLFFVSSAEKEVDKLLKTCPGLELIETHHFAYEQWQGGGVKPFKVDNFVIVPPWEEGVADEDGNRIILDPGVVFGNGLHPTTRDCLKALAYTNRQGPFTTVWVKSYG